MELLKKVVDLVYPHRCPVCDKIIIYGYVHDECINSLTFIGDKRCKVCGKYLEYGIICKDCEKYYHAYDRGFSVFVYDEKMKKSIARFKYSDRQEYADMYALEMAGVISKVNISFDIVIPIPIHKKRFANRGYNQSALIAEKLCKYLKINFSDKILYRGYNTPPLKELTRDKRIEVMKNSIKISDSIKVKGLDILLIDDIYTTGTTIDTCAKVLKENGANKVYFITVAS